MLQIRDFLRYSSSPPALDARSPVFSVVGDGEGVGGKSPHGATGAVLGGMGSASKGPGVPGAGDEKFENLHFSGGMGSGGHDIPEWVLEPASGQVLVFLPACRRKVRV